MPVNGEIISVKFIQSVERTEPHESLIILNNAADVIVRQPVVGGQVFKMQSWTLRKTERSGYDKKEEKTPK